MLGDLIMQTIQAVGLILLIAWVLASALLGFVIWKFRDKSFEDEIEWDVDDVTPEGVAEVRRKSGVSQDVRNYVVISGVDKHV